MRRGGSRAKGNAFENQICRNIRKDLAPFGVTKQDVYRTPLSGGHPFCNDADLIISDRLQPLFPFTVECKHHRDLSVSRVMEMHKIFERFLQQVIRANTTAVANGAGEVFPLLIWKGNFTQTYAATYPKAIISTYGRELPESFNRLHFWFRGVKWAMFNWQDFRKMIIASGQRIG